MARKKKEIESGFDIVEEVEISTPLTPEEILKDDETYSALTGVYFKYLRKENFGHTEEITNRLDKLEIAINKRKKELFPN